MRDKSGLSCIAHDDYNIKECTGKLKTIIVHNTNHTLDELRKIVDHAIDIDRKFFDDMD